MAPKIPPIEEVIHPFKLGQKQVFLPKAVLTLLRPKPGQPPHLATFKVPLTFNKFDFRDYLYNCYGVEVLKVRSFINQQRAKQRSYAGNRLGKWYRPRSIKMMIADLKEPFVWPDPPEDKKPWDHKLFHEVEKGSDEHRRQQENFSKWGPVPMRSRGTADSWRKELSQSAQALTYGLEQWKPSRDTAKLIETAETVKPGLSPAEKSDEAAR